MGPGATAMSVADDDQTARQTPERIQQDIETTRSQMSEKLEALERKLAPRHLVAEVADGFFKAVAGPSQGIAPMIDLVRRNPVPTALIGVGLGWLLLGSGSAQGAAPSAGRAAGNAAPKASRLA